MWDTKMTSIHGDQVHQFRIYQNDKALRYDEVISLWQDSYEFREFYSGLLVESPFSAYRWETPPITQKTKDREFEFVLVYNPRLERIPNRNAFSEYFTNKDEVVAFWNLGGDALLVVPCPKEVDTTYAHLASFMRKAPKSQRHLFWQMTATEMDKHIGDKPTWLNTAGMGIAWLHIRLDSRPKYYSFKPYTVF